MDESEERMSFSMASLHHWAAEGVADRRSTALGRALFATSPGVQSTCCCNAEMPMMQRAVTLDVFLAVPQVFCPRPKS